MAVRNVFTWEYVLSDCPQSTNSVSDRHHSLYTSALCCEYIFKEEKCACNVSHVLLRHLELWYSTQVVAAAEYWDVWELLVVKVEAATPHYNTFLA